MIGNLLEPITLFTLNTIKDFGYGGVFFLMLLESANIPIPSEIIMPFSGFLVSQGAFNFWLLVFFGALGNLVGSLISYAIAFYLSDKALNFFLKFRLLRKKEVDFSINLFQKYGISTAFFSRIFPVIRTFISFPAGLFKVSLVPFSLFTFLGSFLWSLLLTFLGLKLGENWRVLETYFRQFDTIIVFGLFFVFIFWIQHHFFNKRTAFKKDA